MKTHEKLQTIVLLRLVAFLMGMALLILSTKLSAQDDSPVKNYSVYKGKVMDTDTKKPLIFANIAASGTSIGTVTNIDGEFTIKIKDDLNVSSIEISHLGYKNQKVKLTDLTEEVNIIKMTTAIVTLPEIDVRPMDANKLFQQVMSKVSENYSMEANMMTGFYRETIKKRSNYLCISEAVLDIYKAAYENTFDEDLVKIYKGRKSQKYKKNDTLMVKLQGGPRVSILLDIIKNPYILFTRENLRNYKMNFGELQVVDDRINYVIEFNQEYSYEHPLYNGKLYIDQKTLALTAAEFSLNLENPKEAAGMFIKHKPAGLIFTPTNTKYLVKYKLEGEKYIFSYARYELAFRCDWKKRLFESKYNITGEIAVTDRDAKNVKRFTMKEQFKESDIMSDKVQAFTEPDFWGEYNYIQPDESIETALAKYSKMLKRSQR